ncbi:TRAP transporter substrate-binding protein [Acanthopleuribacter pedis]|uniref:TRAP transporter substrate-binding protein n=1 Tax=Acanthopleuribacter pedis TaxID=442870 RepID=A0A8J7QDW2_9BACT|nr:TRAP transporter substrate-binding protein [Acanthopleuribacter pedis]MBO1321360.1 TRAP transporter substrate-binding protein [Acanthopleuribacter pedis]
MVFRSAQPPSEPKKVQAKTGRRAFLWKAASGLTAAALVTHGCGGSSPNGHADGGPAVHTSPKVRWRLASSFPRALDTIYGVADTLAKRVSDLTNGAFTIRPYPQGELVPAMEVLDAVQQGTVQIGHTASYYYKGKNPVLAFDCAVPFGLTARQQSAWLVHGGGLELMRSVFADFNIVNYPGGNTGMQMGGWFRRELNNAKDINGLKMRIPGLGGEVMSRMGATVQVLAGGDIFPALERGAIDATEWVGPYDDEKLGFYKVAKFYYYPGWWEPGPSLSFMVNQAALESLPAHYRGVLEVAMAEADHDMIMNYDRKNPPALARLLEAGAQLRPFARDIMELARKTSFDLMEELAAKDAGYRKVYEQWSAFRDASYQWFNTAETEYAAFARQMMESKG